MCCLAKDTQEGQPSVGFCTGTPYLGEIVVVGAFSRCCRGGIAQQLLAVMSMQDCPNLFKRAFAPR
jgi:hypothetical protein